MRAEKLSGGLEISGSAFVFYYGCLGVFAYCSSYYFVRIYFPLHFLLCRPTYRQKLPVNFIQNSKGGITKYQL